MNPYDLLFRSPELVAWYAGVVLFLVAWLFISVRLKYRLATRIHANYSTRRNTLIPDWGTSVDLFWFATVAAVNLVLLGAYLYAVV